MKSYLPAFSLFLLTPLVSGQEGDQIGLQDLEIQFAVAEANHPSEENAEEPVPIFSDRLETDLVRFTNGDLMHGTFKGFEDAVIWQRDDLAEPARFTTENLRQVVFRKKDLQLYPKDTSKLTLKNGDQLPGLLISMNEKAVEFDSPLAGLMTISRDDIASLEPKPFGGDLRYIGPFDSSSWIMPVAKPPKAKEGEEIEKATAKPKPSWLFSGAAFYNLRALPLIRSEVLQDTGRLFFRAKWKAQLELDIALHSDLKVLREKPEDSEPEDWKWETLVDPSENQKMQVVPWLNDLHHRHRPANIYGTGYLISINRNYIRLRRHGFNQNGAPVEKNVQGTRHNLDLQNRTEAIFEIRFDRPNSHISLYIDGELITQWHDADSYKGQGQALAFCAQQPKSTKISDIVVADWSGFTDSPISFSRADRDTVLLSTGLDRFSGQISKIENDLVLIDTDYASLKIPLAQVSQIHLQKGTQPSPAEDEEAVEILWQPFGRLRLQPDLVNRDSFSGTSPLLGPLKVSLDRAILLRFQEESASTTDWFSDL